jgi:hypothetical protein
MDPRRLFVVSVLVWTGVVTLAVMLFVGQVPPCPELRPVGLSDAQRDAIAKMCVERAHLGLAPLVGVPIWVLGTGVIAVLAILVARRRARDRR